MCQVFGRRWLRDERVCRGGSKSGKVRYAGSDGGREEKRERRNDLLSFCQKL